MSILTGTVGLHYKTNGPVRAADHKVTTIRLSRRVLLILDIDNRRLGLSEMRFDDWNGHCSCRTNIVLD